MGDHEHRLPEPGVRALQYDDLTAVLSLGWRDFKQAPQYGLFFGAVYAIGGWLLLAAIFHLKQSWMAYPLVIGFALVGPFIATGLYEVSRRLEAQQKLSWSGVLGVIYAQHRRELGWMAFVMLFIFWIWIYQIRTLIAVFFGFEGFASLSGFLTAVFTTANGLTFLLVGHVVGAVISLVLFALTVVSCPMLLDRDVDFVTAMITSIRVVAASPPAMFAWGVFVIVSVVLAALTLFLGLLIVLPILGHATWHLYQRAVVQ